MGETRGTLKGLEKCLKYFVGKPEGVETLEVLVVGRRIILK
jgi:hypothetical protein